MTTAEPSPATWTVRFRYHRTTVLLHIDPLQSVASIKADLLSALRQTSPEGKLEGSIDLPESTEDIQLARPLDINDPSAGWRGLQVPDGNSAAGKGRIPKSKGKAKEGSDPVGLDAECLKSLGVKDNALLAFSFTTLRANGARKQPEDGTNDEGDDMAEDSEDEHESWDVVMPTWEDQYGVVNQGDSGAIKDFEG